METPHAMEDGKRAKGGTEVSIKREGNDITKTKERNVSVGKKEGNPFLRYASRVNSKRMHSKCTLSWRERPKFSHSSVHN
jgi:hypothetical protein